MIYYSENFNHSNPLEFQVLRENKDVNFVKKLIMVESKSVDVIIA